MAHPAIRIMEKEKHIGNLQTIQMPGVARRSPVADIRGARTYLVLRTHPQLMTRPNLLNLVQHLRIEQNTENAFIKFLVAHRGVGFIKITLRNLREAAIHRGLDGGRSEKGPQGNGRAGTRNHFGGSQIIGERLLEGGRVGKPRRIPEVEPVPIAFENIRGTLRRFGDHARNRRKRVMTLRRRGNAIRLTLGRSRTSARGAQQQTQQHRRNPRAENPEVKCVIRFLAFHNISILSCFIYVYSLLAHLHCPGACPPITAPEGIARYPRGCREELWLNNSGINVG